MPKIHYKISTEQLTRYFHEVYTAFSYQLDFSGFATLYKKLLHSDIKFFAESLRPYSADTKRVKMHEFIKFLKAEQKDDLHERESEVFNFMNNYLLDPTRHYIDPIPYFNVTEFIDFLFSKHNEAWDPKCDCVYQDMNQPLTRYWVATSHNTYLMGDQFMSESSTECYARCLRMGCRCLECKSISF